MVVLWWSSDPVIHTVGTVTNVKDGECYVEYSDQAGVEHTHINSGGKSGCHDREGDDTDLYYPPTDPESADTWSPTELRLAGVMLLGVTAFTGGEAWLKVRRGAWSQVPSTSHKRRRPHRQRRPRRR